MIGRLLGSVTPWLLAALIGLSVFQYQYTQRVTADRERAEMQAVHANERAEILRRHQQFQRQQIQTLNDALAERDRALTIIADDIRASTAALQSLGETDAEAREWLDSDLPSGITDWVRELQQPSTGDGVRLPNGTRTPNQ
ncbi:hypothetical protein [Halomonas sp. MS1]|nr:hypothetical protein [Halomonas sp. MS1]UTD54934.1 hypothetical protein NF683_17575 [Halomonas sp. MS1]